MSNEELLNEWQGHYRAAVRYRSENPAEVADVLTFGTVVSSLAAGLVQVQEQVS